jgi:large subunit ribosomal protein L4
MAKANVYSKTKKSTPSIALPKDFDEKENMILLAQAIRVYGDRQKPQRGKTKTRGEVVKSGRKIWRQKGTGRARHGDVGAPIFVGGGKAHGPRGEKRELTLPKKMKKKALSIALSLKAKDGKVAIIDGVSKVKKTNDAKKFLDEIVKKQLKGKEPNRITICLAKESKDAQRFFRNIKNTKTYDYEDLNAHKVFYGGLLVIDKDALKVKKEKSK